MRRGREKSVFGLAMLAYLDAMDYAGRVGHSSIRELFAKVPEKYAACAARTMDFAPEGGYGQVQIADGSALDLPLADCPVDGIVTSPPYSFAVDYVDGNARQLSYLECDAKLLRERMIGLRGRGRAQRVKNYLADMHRACGEMARALKPGKFCVIVAGTNVGQTGGLRLEQSVTKSCAAAGMDLVRAIPKPAAPARNMRGEEHILFFRKKPARPK